MMEKTQVNEWKKKFRSSDRWIAREEVLWLNPLMESTITGLPKTGVTAANVKDASDRLKRFASYIEHVFPETKVSNGIIESPITAIPNMKEALVQSIRN